jgi:DNA-binding winged helix-turn-helix (wHTH) protein
MFSFTHADSRMTTDMHWVSDPAAMSFVFGHFRLSPRQQLLTEADKPVRLGSRAFDILVALLERPGELVTKEELMARVWPNTFVAPANLAVHISALRRALGDGRKGNRYVLNIPRLGYRFVAPVTVDKDATSSRTVTVRPAQEYDLAAHLTQRIGRADANDESLHKQQRLLTIVSPLEIGNTKLAVAVVGKVIGVHEDRVFLVDVAPVEEH